MVAPLSTAGPVVGLGLEGSVSATVVSCLFRGGKRAAGRRTGPELNEVEACVVAFADT